jgi:hypothetical protein
MVTGPDGVMDSVPAVLGWTAATGTRGSGRQFAALGGAKTACIRTSPAWLSLVRAECGDAKLARGRASEAQCSRDPGTAFQTSDANLAQLGTIAAVDHTNEHSCITSMRLAEFHALSGTGSARRDTRLNLLLVHGERSMTRRLPTN